MIAQSFGDFGTVSGVFTKGYKLASETPTQVDTGNCGTISFNASRVGGDIINNLCLKAKYNIGTHVILLKLREK